MQKSAIYIPLEGSLYKAYQKTTTELLPEIIAEIGLKEFVNVPIRGNNLLYRILANKESGVSDFILAMELVIMRCSCISATSSKKYLSKGQEKVISMIRLI